MFAEYAGEASIKKTPKGHRHYDTTASNIKSLTWPQVLSFRLQRQYLSSRAPKDHLSEALGDATGVQAQIPSAAQMGLWCRVQGIYPADVERALWKDRSIVKTWVMRGALHLLPAKELPTYLGGLRREGLLREKQWMSRYGLREDDFGKMSAAISEALSSGPMTRRELANAVVSLAGTKARPWVEHVWGGVVRLACMEGRACFGPNRGREVTFVSLEEWLPTFRDAPREDAARELAVRYLRAHGPATPQDFAAWTGMRVTTAREIWEGVGDDFVGVSLEGSTTYSLAEDLELLSSSPVMTSVRLLPHFDTYILAHKDKEHLIQEAHYKRVFRKAGWISPTLLVDGRAAGTWSMKRHRSALNVNVEPFDELVTGNRELVIKEVEALGEFLGLSPRIRFLHANA